MEERIISDYLYRFGNRIGFSDRFPRREVNQLRPIKAENNAVDRNILAVVVGHKHFFQCVATVEPVAHDRPVIRKSHALQILAVLERRHRRVRHRRRTQFGNSGGNNKFRNRTIPERQVADFLQRAVLFKRNVREVGAIGEGVRTEQAESCGKHNAFQTGTTSERARRGIGTRGAGISVGNRQSRRSARFKRNVRQGGTIAESIVRDVRHAVGNGDRSQCAVLESIGADRLRTRGNRDGSQRRAFAEVIAGKCLCGPTRFKGDRRQFRTAVEHVRTECLDRLG